MLIYTNTFICHHTEVSNV